MPQTAETIVPTRRRQRLASAALALAATLALAGCSGGGPDAKFAPDCPQLRLLPDAADLTLMRGTGTDLTDLMLQARITAVPAACMDGGRGIVKAKLNVAIEATRGPAATTSTAELPYLITVTRGDRPIEQQMFIATAKFPANVDRMTITGEDITLAFPTSQDAPVTDYTVYVSFRLTATELAYNRSHPR